MSHVDYKRWSCRPVDFKKTSCHPVDFKKTSCHPVDFKKVPCRMILRPIKCRVAMSILGIYTHIVCNVTWRYSNRDGIYQLSYSCIVMFIWKL